jgi:plastocyanin
VFGVVLVVVLRIVTGRRGDKSDSGRTARVGKREVRRSFPFRLAFWGFLFVPLSVVIGAAAGNVTGVFAVFPLVVLAVIAAVALRSTGRGLIAALVLGVLLLLASIELGLLHLSHPQSFSDFVPAVLRVVGLLLAVLGTASALRQRRGGVVPSTRRQRRALVAGGSLLVVLAVASGVLTVTQQTKVGTVKGAKRVAMKGDEFVPDIIHARPGENVSVLVHNVDAYAHTFTIDDLNVDQYVGPRSERLITFNMPATATKHFVLTCAVTGHENMRGEVIVEPASG